MIRRAVSIVLLVWAMGFILFAVALPLPAQSEKTEAVVVLTGGPGRIARGVDVLGKGWADRMFVSGVARAVKPHEFAREHAVKPGLMACCVTLGFRAVDTVSNAEEVSGWLARERVGSVRLVTSDWHMRRAALEMRRSTPAGTAIVEDAVQTRPSLRMLFLEYHKYLSRLVLGLVGA